MFTGRSGRVLAVSLLVPLGAFAGAKAPPDPKTDPPPEVEFKPETTRHPDPENFDGRGDPRDYEWGDALPLVESGRIMLVYSARSEHGVRAANLRYRVIAKDVAADKYPEEYRKIEHPRDDPRALVFARLPLKPFTADPLTEKLGKFDPDLGLFEQSWRGLDGAKRADRFKVNVELYLFARDREAGGRFNFETANLTKTVPDGTGGTKPAKIELGDTVEVYVEVFDAALRPNGKFDLTRPAGYSPAKRKTVVTPEDAVLAIRNRDENNQRERARLIEEARRKAYRLIQEASTAPRGPR